MSDNEPTVPSAAPGRFSQQAAATRGAMARPRERLPRPAESRARKQCRARDGSPRDVVSRPRPSTGSLQVTHDQVQPTEDGYQAANNDDGKTCRGQAGMLLSPGWLPASWQDGHQSA